MSGIQNISQSNITVNIDGNQIRPEAASESPALNLKTGATIQGTVVSISDTEDGKMATINVGDTVINAKLAEEMGLREGQILNFAIRNANGRNVSITPLFENISVNQSTLKALAAAGIEVNNDTVQMVKEMMEAGLPINKDSLVQMNRNLSLFPNTSISTMVEMKSLDIPITENNITQFESYKNYEHQVVKEMQTIIDELPAAFNEVMQSGDTTGALNLYGNVLKLFSGDSGQEQGNISGTNANVTADEVAQAAVNKENPDVASETKSVTDAEGKASLIKQDMPEVKEYIDAFKTIGLSQKAIDEFVKDAATTGTDKAFQNLFKELSKSFEGTDLSDTAKTEAFKKIFSSGDYNKALSNKISNQWLLKPDDVQYKENVENLYQRLGNQVRQLGNVISQSLGNESKLGQATNNLNNNLDFMNQLNHMFQYVQLPLQMAGQNAHGDLYVYKNKNKRMSEDGSVSAVLHLDMDNLGPVDVYVKMKDAKVSTNFYVADDSVLDLLNENMHILNERLEKRGYTMQVRTMLHDELDGQDAAVDEMLDVMKTPVLSTASFDARA